MCCVIITNFVILKISNLWNFWAVLLIFAQIAACYVYTYVINEILMSYAFVIWKFWHEYLNNPAAWLGLILAVATCLLCFTAASSVRDLNKIVKNSFVNKVRNK